MRWFDDMDYMYPNHTGEVTEPMIDLLLRGSKSYHCGHYLHALDSIQYTKILEDLENERINRKSKEIIDMISYRKFNWNKILLMHILRTVSDRANKLNYMELGFMVNDTAFDRERESLFNLETLLIYPSGLLDTLPNDNFVQSVRHNGEMLYKKYNLDLLPPISWTPISSIKHPIIRLSQIAHLYHNNEMLFNRVINCRNRNDVMNLFSGVGSSAEWCKYFSREHSSIGVMKSDLMAINLVITILYAYGTYFSNDDMVYSAFEMLESLPAESNSYIDGWRKRGIVPRNAFDTQALIQLRAEYCLRRRCPECPVAKHMCSLSSIINRLPNFFDFNL